MKSVHEFAIYINQFSSLIGSVAQGGQLVIDDQETYHRITRVLRLHIDEQCVLFDRYMHGSFIIKDFQAKRRVVGTLISKESNKVLSPQITFMLPLLKREDLDAAIYSLVEIGVNAIQLVVTEKVQRTWRGENEFERLQRVMIAAAEQSKYFAFPELLLPISFDEAMQKIQENSEMAVFFDPDGNKANQIITMITQQSPKKLILMVGPEGDLTQAEKDMLKKCGALFCALTPTILRARQAIALSSGMIRSLL